VQYGREEPDRVRILLAVVPIAVFGSGGPYGWPSGPVCEPHEDVVALECELRRWEAGYDLVGEIAAEALG
jgi:hypothetical protein